METWAGRDYFKCVTCGVSGSLYPDRQGSMSCRSCGGMVAYADEILDFVSGRVGTQLDDIDYDKVYGISDATDAELMAQIRNSLGPRLGERYHAALEMGAGTGRGTSAFVQAVPCTHLAVTDVSPKMLQTCRRRLSRLQLETKPEFSYSTFSGTEDCLADSSLDLIFGVSVLHHILDWPRALDICIRALKPGGLAFFTEPAAPFHRALIDATRSVYEILLQRPEQVSLDDVGAIRNWIFEVYFNLKYAGQAEFLMNREDKHMFDRRVFLSTAKSLGFEAAEALPLPGPYPDSFEHPYAWQLGLSEMGSAQFQALFLDQVEIAFRGLAPSDRAPTYLLCMRKPETGGRLLRFSGSPPDPKPPANVARLVLADCKYNLELESRIESGHKEVRLSGWIVAPIAVNRVRISMGTGSLDYAVAFPRPDIRAAFRTMAALTEEIILFSGIVGGHVLTVDVSEQRVGVSAEFVNGQWLTSDMPI